MYDADISEIATYPNLIKLNIQRKNDNQSLAFLEKLIRVEELQLWHEELTTICPQNVEAIEKMPKLNNLSGFKTKSTIFDKLLARPSPFYASFIEELGFDR